MKKLLDKDVCEFLYNQGRKLVDEELDNDEPDEEDIRFSEKAERDARRVIEEL
jgi:hypothetical protein